MKPRVVTALAACAGLGIIVLSGCGLPAKGFLEESSVDNQPRTAEVTGTVKMAFLTRDGCANTPTMRANLDAALSLLGWKLQVETVDASKLPAADRHRGYGTPTVLINDKDLFGMSEPKKATAPT